jgi:hypothetical protein
MLIPGLNPIPHPSAGASIKFINKEGGRQTTVFAEGTTKTIMPSQ